MKSFAHEITGMSVYATDGEIGTVNDVLFDPHSWKVRHLEVSTGWIFGRDVLIPVEKVKSIDAPKGGVKFDLTKQQIEDSPPAEPAHPVGRDYEARLVEYYGLSPYWGAPPEVGVPPQALPVKQRSSDDSEGTQLMSVGEIDGYELDAQGEAVGTVRDVLIDLDRWKITSLMADLGGIFTRDAATIATGPVTGIDRAKRIVHVALPKEKVDKSHRVGLDDLPYVFPYVPPFA